jgi:hypothetical protein
VGGILIEDFRLRGGSIASAFLLSLIFDLLVSMPIGDWHFYKSKSFFLFLVIDFAFGGERQVQITGFYSLRMVCFTVIPGENLDVVMRHLTTSSFIRPEWLHT